MVQVQDSSQTLSNDSNTLTNEVHVHHNSKCLSKEIDYLPTVPNQKCCSLTPLSRAHRTLGAKNFLSLNVKPETKQTEHFGITGIWEWIAI